MSMIRAQASKRVKVWNGKQAVLAAFVFIGGPLLLFALFLIDISLGQADLKVRTVFEAIVSPTDSLEHNMVRYLRMPRAMMGVLAGGALAVAGVLLQSLTRNPMASASTLGINAGAYAAVVAATVFAPSMLQGFSLLVALLGGIIAALLAYLLAGGMKSTPARMALAGMAVSMIFASVTGAMQLLYENQTAGLFLWGSGTLTQNDWSGFLFSWPWIAICTGIALTLAPCMDILALGDDTARSLGQRVARTRLIGLLTAVFLAAVTVSVVGPIGFVGLITPHLIRLLGFRRHFVLIPASLIWGSVVVLSADVCVQLFMKKFGILPVGAFTALIGAPFLIWLTIRTIKMRSDSTDQHDMNVGIARRRIPFKWLMTGTVVLFICSIILALSLGDLKFSPAELFALLTGGGSDFAKSIIIDLRLPRTLVAALAGAALAASGMLLQGVVRNPLADPSIMGVTSGAGVGALLLLIAWPQMPVALLPAAAFVGALAAASIVYLIARKGGFQPIRVALGGIAVSAFGTAIIQALVIISGLKVAVALAWISGSTYARGWSDLSQLVIWPIILLPLAWLLCRKLDLLGLGDESASGLGIHAHKTRLLAAAIAVALAGAAVAVVGTVGFVGLLAPHAARMLSGYNHKRLLLLSTLMGAVLLVLADLIGRVALAPKEIPSGLVVALIGAPYFLWLMRKSLSR